MKFVDCTVIVQGIADIVREFLPGLISRNVVLALTNFFGGMLLTKSETDFLFDALRQHLGDDGHPVHLEKNGECFFTVFKGAFPKIMLNTGGNTHDEFLKVLLPLGATDFDKDFIMSMATRVSCDFLVFVVYLLLGGKFKNIH
jgi:hypothetical protein